MKNNHTVPNLDRESGNMGDGDGDGGSCDNTTQTLVEAALQVLNTEDPVAKARLTAEVAARWQQGAISATFGERDAHLLVPDRPCRLSNVKLVPPSLMPKLGKGGSLHSRQAIVHSLVHTESWAIDLSWDIIARFGRREAMPVEFFDDFVKVAEDEARHFTLLAARLEEMGSHYGAFPAHDGLWDSAMQTSHNLLARLAVEHCVHEARGLDVLPTTISRFRKGGDEQTATLLETVVYPEEITHCAAGVKWFRFLCQRGPVQQETKLSEDISVVENLSKSQEVDDGGSQDIKALEQSFRCLETQSDDEQKVIHCFHSTVRKNFRGPLKPPFNAEARKAAGFESAWYEPLAMRSE